ncbi:MAG TPA: ACT domain-containing protein [Actinomycetota bacterium]|nr:ACT domain-containing protein [Actinomycetota bacterium]
MRERLDAARELAGQQHREGVRATDVAAGHARRVDDVLASLFEAGPPYTGVALIAVGGYGRLELAPYSDLDVLVLHRGTPPDHLEEMVRRVVYPLWDAGREVGQRVRNLAEVVRSLERVDESAATLDSRLVAGDPAVFAEMEALLQRELQRHRHRFFSQLLAETGSRHESFGHAGHLLEPHVRDSAGALRDIHTLGWAGRLIGGQGLDPLVREGILSAADADAVGASQDFLLRVRFEMHLRSQRRQDRLHLEDQDPIAESLGFGTVTPEGAGAGDELMRRLYRHCRTTEAVVSSAWQDLVRRRARRRLRSGRHIAGEGWVVQGGRLEVLASPDPLEDPSGWLSMFMHAIRADVPLSRRSLNRLQEHVAEGEPARWNPTASDAFLEILRLGRKSVPAMQAMDSTGLLAALIPEWKHVSCLPQRNLYHRYSVDIHSFQAVAELVESAPARVSGSKVPARGREAPAAEQADVSGAWLLVDDPRPLLLAALLHDCGKGRGGDHAVLGARITASTLSRMGLANGVAADAEFLVRSHLLLPETALRRDLEDEGTITEVARAAGTAHRLAMLFLLARADALATGPEAWSVFRSSLVRQLYSSAMKVLSGEPVAASGPGPRIGVEEMSRPFDGEPVVEVHPGAEADRMLLIARDRPGLLASVCGVLALRGVDVLSAEAATRPDGTAVEAFIVRGSRERLTPDRWHRITADVAAAARGGLDLDEPLRAKSQAERRPAAPARPTDVVVDNKAAEAMTVVEVHATDRLGLLHSVTRTLAECGCDVRRAKVATYGAEVVDVFYVTAKGGGRIHDPQDVETLREALAAAVSQMD